MNENPKTKIKSNWLTVQFHVHTNKTILYSYIHVQRTDSEHFAFFSKIISTNMVIQRTYKHSQFILFLLFLRPSPLSVALSMIQRHKYTKIHLIFYQIEWENSNAELIYDRFGYVFSFFIKRTHTRIIKM